MYIAPLRHAILHLATSGCPFTVAAISRIGLASPQAVARYTHLLANRGVLLLLPDGRVKPARNFAEWAAREPKTKPGGHRHIRYTAVPRESVACLA